MWMELSIQLLGCGGPHPPPIILPGAILFMSFLEVECPAILLAKRLAGWGIYLGNLCYCCWADQGASC